ncbi:MAG: exodeoxyribonuclease VII small subunit [Gammaproteobacteria bacterium]
MPKKTTPDDGAAASAAETAELDAGIAQFETALEELEGLIDSLEQGEVSLEEGLKQFERGVELARGCQRTLKAAEQRVKTLLEDDPQGDLLDFHQDPEA